MNHGSQKVLKTTLLSSVIGLSLLCAALLTGTEDAPEPAAYIVQGDTLEAVHRGLDSVGVTANRELAIIRATTARLTPAQVEALKAATVSAQSALESTQAGYEVGTRTIVDVLNVQRNLFSSQRDYLNSRYSYIINGLSLKSAAGNLSEEDLQRVNAWLEH